MEGRTAAKQAYNVGRFFQALGDNTRLRLLNLSGDQEICVCYFVEMLGGPQPKISRHLAYFRSAETVAARREGEVDAVPDRDAISHWSLSGASTSARLAERGKGNAGRQGTACKKLLLPFEVRAS